MSVPSVYYVPVHVVQQQQQHVHGPGAQMMTSGRPHFCFPDAATMYTSPEAYSVAMGSLAHTQSNLGPSTGVGTVLQQTQLGSGKCVRDSNWWHQQRLLLLLNVLNAPGPAVSAAELSLLAEDGALECSLAAEFPLPPTSTVALQRLLSNPAVGAGAGDPIVAALYASCHAAAVEGIATGAATSQVEPVGTGCDDAMNRSRRSTSALSALDQSAAETPGTPTAAAGENMLFINQSSSSLQGGTTGSAAQTADW